MAFHPKGFICFVSEPDETVVFSSSTTGDDLDFESEDIFLWLSTSILPSSQIQAQLARLSLINVEPSEITIIWQWST